MLGFRLQVTLILICIIAFVYLFYKMKKKRVDVKYTLPWLLLDFLMLLMAGFPKGLAWLCRLIGIRTTSNAVFFAALLFLLVIVYVMSRTISRLNNEIRALSQRIALDDMDEEIVNTDEQME